jgi:hypothetical protein
MTAVPHFSLRLGQRVRVSDFGLPEPSTGEIGRKRDQLWLMGDDGWCFPIPASAVVELLTDKGAA